MTVLEDLYYGNIQPCDNEQSADNYSEYAAEQPCFLKKIAARYHKRAPADAGADR